MAYLKCEISEGMFPNEYAIITNLYDGREVSGFFHKNRVDEQKGLEVEVMEIHGDKAIIFNPQGSFIYGPGNIGICIVVNTNQLT